MWFVIFNKPEECSNPCGEYDLGLSSASVLWETGFISDGDGHGHFSAHLREKNPLGPVLFGPGLRSAKKADVHFIIRCHGEVIPELAADQLSTVNRGVQPRRAQRRPLRRRGCGSSPPVAGGTLAELNGDAGGGARPGEGPRRQSHGAR